MKANFQSTSLFWLVVTDVSMLIADNLIPLSFGFNTVATTFLLWTLPSRNWVCLIYWNWPGTRFVGFHLGSSWVRAGFVLGSRSRTQVWKTRYELRCCCSICSTFLSNYEVWILNWQYSGIMDYGDYAIIFFHLSNFWKNYLKLRTCRILSGNPKTQT